MLALCFRLLTQVAPHQQQERDAEQQEGEDRRLHDQAGTHGQDGQGGTYAGQPQALAAPPDAQHHGRQPQDQGRLDHDDGRPPERFVQPVDEQVVKPGVVDPPQIGPGVGVMVLAEAELVAEPVWRVARWNQKSLLRIGKTATRAVNARTAPRACGRAAAMARASSSGVMGSDRGRGGSGTGGTSAGGTAWMPVGLAAGGGPA